VSRLTRERKERYAAKGCVFPIDVLTRTEAARYRRRLEDMEARCGHLHYSPKPHLTFTFVDELIRHARILDPVESIIGPDILVWDSTFIIKEARDARFVSWHQDLTYWGLEPPDVVSVWLALSASTPESGCMRFVPGSHAVQLPHHDTFAEQNILSRGQEVTVEVDEREAVDIVLAPGQMSLHHGRVVHGSAPNRSDDRRIGFNIQYLPTHVRQVVGKRDSATLVRGVDRYGHFDEERRPSADFTAEELRAFRQGLEERRSEYLYRGADRP
jgi:non-heme Fe2+,alpha-ketoglutarate-dependent halogenase